MDNIKKNKIIYIFICIIIVILCVIILIFLDKKDTSSEDYNYLEISEQSVNSNITEGNSVEVQNNIYIHIMGEVNNPGVVIAKEGDRIKDIIEKAGGTTENANLKNVNLAFKVEDGQKINIPNKNDNTQDDIEKEQKEKNNNEKNNVSKTEKIDEDSNNYITKSNGQNIIVDDGKNENANKNSKVNINTATQTELETLNGIGPSTASKIIKYRNEKGKFKKIEDIKNVSGIGEAKFKKIEADIVV